MGHRVDSIPASTRWASGLLAAALLLLPGLVNALGPSPASLRSAQQAAVHAAKTSKALLIETMAALHAGQPEHLTDRLAAINAFADHNAQHLPPGFLKSLKAAQSSDEAAQKINLESLHKLIKQVDPMGRFDKELRHPVFAPTLEQTHSEGSLPSFKTIPKFQFVDRQVKQFADGFKRGASNPDYWIDRELRQRPDLAAKVNAFLKPPRDKHIFVVGSSADTAYVEYLKQAHEPEYKVFFYSDCLLGGINLCSEEFVGAMAKLAGRVIAIDSAEANASAFVRTEIPLTEEIKGGRRLVYIHFDQNAAADAAGQVVLTSRISCFMLPARITRPGTRPISACRDMAPMQSAKNEGFGTLPTALPVTFPVKQ